MTYKVIQWGSGNVGARLISETLRRPNLELVGLFVYNPDKIGRDAGELAGCNRAGIAAVGDRTTILSMPADVVIHAPLASLVYGDHPEEDLETICALLASGKNVITSVGYMYPSVYGDAVVSRLEDACRQGNSSFHGTGANPGWLGDLIPLTMTALSGHIDRILVQEISDFSGYPSKEIIFDTMGFGLEPGPFEEKSARYSNWLNGLFRESIQMIADGIRLPLDGIDTTFSFKLAPQALDIAAGHVAAGTVAAQRWQWSGRVNGQDRIVHETIWRAHRSMADDWPRGDHSVRIEGQPNMAVEFGQRWNDDPLSATPMHAINAIPTVCDAKPGIRTFLDLPWIVGQGAAH